MQHPSLIKYAHYIFEKTGRMLIEREFSWATYSQPEEGIVKVHDMWVHPDYRRSGEARILLSEIEKKSNGASKMIANVEINTNGHEQALMAQLKVGFVPYKLDEKRIHLVREICQT